MNCIQEYDNQIKNCRELLNLKPSKPLRYQLYKEINNLTVERLRAIDKEIIESVRRIQNITKEATQ